MVVYTVAVLGVAVFGVPVLGVVLGTGVVLVIYPFITSQTEIV